MIDEIIFERYKIFFEICSKFLKYKIVIISICHYGL